MIVLWYVEALATRYLQDTTNRRTQPYRAARALDTDVVRRSLATIDHTTLTGARDYALISVAVVTGRRVSELAGLRFGDLEPTESGRASAWRASSPDISA